MWHDQKPIPTLFKLSYEARRQVHVPLARLEEIPEALSLTLRMGIPCLPKICPPLASSRDTAGRTPHILLWWRSPSLLFALQWAARLVPSDSNPHVSNRQYLDRNSTMLQYDTDASLSSSGSLPQQWQDNLSNGQRCNQRCHYQKRPVRV